MPSVADTSYLFYIVWLMGTGYLGEFEQLVLLAVMRLQADAYGVTVRQEIAGRTRRDVSIGAIYATLDRLETKGFVESHVGEPTPQRGGRAKRYFRITGPGVEIVNRTLEDLRNMTDGVSLSPLTLLEPARS
jgi:PadR family transcriptional regulator PadR